MADKETFRILHLEDLPSTAASVKQALISYGLRPENIIQVGTVTDAKDAIEDMLSGAQPKFDLVIVDLYVSGDLWAGTRFLDSMKKSIGPKSDQGPSAVVYSRFARTGSVYEIKNQLNAIISKLNEYKNEKVIDDYFEKNEMNEHRELLDFIETLLTKS